MTSNKRLFRALPAGLGSWVYGSVVDNGKDRCYIVQTHLNQRIPVIRETVGQYVPCLDAFEGDTLFGSDSGHGSARPTWYGTVTYMAEQSRLMIVDDIGDLYEVDDFQFEKVMGNIHQDKHYFREQLISLQLVKSILGDRDVIVSHETAALLLDLATPAYQSTIHIYSTVDIDIPGVTTHKVDILQDIPCLMLSGIQITIPDQTIKDLTEDTSDTDILQSALKNYQVTYPDDFHMLIKDLPLSHKDISDIINLDVEH